MASLLAERRAAHHLVLFRRGHSGSGKMWFKRRLLEQLEGAQISITCIEGGAANHTIPPATDNGTKVKLTKQLFDTVAKWSKTAKTAANESSSRTVVRYRMDGFLLINMPGGEEVRDRPVETKRINTTNLAGLDTLHHFQKTVKVTKQFLNRNRAVAEFFLKPLRIPRVCVLVAMVLRDTYVSNSKALGPLKGRFQDQRSQRH
ncbi:hypothetical protein FN846DRAFT_912725 [Sphaerosporella brunnea]|uniref:P-loop containing nucleoside triphosphate hydrolase protein n=1 Tax=Sphaerosporella brunnea TaxID=1250544 RepID=A0A5J5EHK0_9PEZI|nr:hypothetical protein FN846DRAFT_912725 [Sphaerosporella brunnea]